MMSGSDVVAFIVNKYYAGDMRKAADASGYSKQQLADWMNGIREPKSDSVDYLIHCTIVPEFTIIAEYKPVDFSGGMRTIRSQLAPIFKGHERSSGLYAYYDSMANLIYLGKSDGRLLEECCGRLLAKVNRKFPKGAPQPDKRYEVTSYISAYYVKKSIWADYAKHIESLILRISKPALNTNIGSLEKAYLESK